MIKGFCQPRQIPIDSVSNPWAGDTFSVIDWRSPAASVPAVALIPSHHQSTAHSSRPTRSCHTLSRIARKLRSIEAIYPHCEWSGGGRPAGSPGIGTTGKLSGFHLRRLVRRARSCMSEQFGESPVRIALALTIYSWQDGQRSVALVHFRPDEVSERAVMCREVCYGVLHVTALYRPNCLNYNRSSP